MLTLHNKTWIHSLPFQRAIAIQGHQCFDLKKEAIHKRKQFTILVNILKCPSSSILKKKMQHNLVPFFAYQFSKEFLKVLISSVGKGGGKPSHTGGGQRCVGNKSLNT